MTKSSRSGDMQRTTWPKKISPFDEPKTVVRLNGHEVKLVKAPLERIYRAIPALVSSNKPQHICAQRRAIAKTVGERQQKTQMAGALVFDELDRVSRFTQALGHAP